MDQVKVYLRLLVKYHFWVLVGVASLFGLICWWMAASGLATETDRNWKTVDGAYKGLDRVGGGQKPPNAKFAAGVGEKNDGLKQKVLEEWRERYDSQQKLFKWPDIEGLAADLSAITPDAPIPDVLRRRYMNNVFPKTLDDMVFLTADYLRPKSTPTQPEEAAADGQKKDDAPDVAEAEREAALHEAVEMEGLVVWSKAHRDQLTERYDLLKHARQEGVPTSLNIRLAQEDVWMLENLAKVVRETNKGAQDVGAVPIKRIDTLDIAQWAINEAVRDAAKVSGLEKSTEGEGGRGGMTGGGMAASGGGDEATAHATPEEREKVLDDELLNGRYLNDLGQPTMAGETPYAEFKLLFVRMKVVIDQRKIPDLLVNCANAPVPIEVVYFRMHEPVAPSGGRAVAAAPAGGGGAGLGGSRGALPGGGNPGGGGGAKADDIEATPTDVTVEVCGVVQIYNPPDETKLATGSAADPSKRSSAMPAALVKPPRSTQSSGGGFGTAGGLGTRGQ